MRHPALSLALAASIATACASGPPLAVEEPVQVVTDQARSEPPAQLADRCAGHDDLFLEPVAPIAADWQGAVTVGGLASVTVMWCGAGMVTVTSVTLLRPATADAPVQPLYVREPDATTGRLACGEALTIEVSAPAMPASLEVVALATDASGAQHTARIAVEAVDDPERAALRAECEAAGGEWSAHGLAGVESCDRPTRDAGQRCTSDADCEGPCLETGTEPLTGTTPVGVVVPSCGGGGELRLVVGRCHDRSLRFGCFARLEDVRVECIAPGFARRSRVVCVD